MFKKKNKTTAYFHLDIQGQKYTCSYMGEPDDIMNALCTAMIKDSKILMAAKMAVNAVEDVKLQRDVDQLFDKLPTISQN